MANVQLCQSKCGRRATAWIAKAYSGWGGKIIKPIRAACDRCGKGFEVVERIEQ